MDTKTVNSSALIPRIWEESVSRIGFCTQNAGFRYKILLGISLKLTHFGLVEFLLLGLEIEYRML